MKKTTILALGIGAVATTAVGACCWILGTWTTRGLVERSDPRRDAGDGEADAYFSSDYRTARSAFLDAAREAGARVASFRNPHEGPDGEILFTDVAQIGPDGAQLVVVLSSGTHGVEGFAGSGIQTRLLREGIASRLSPRVRVVMIHGINPYGMAHVRRFTEENIDLNRNFRDHGEPPPPNPDYERLAWAIAPESLGFWSEVLGWARLLWFRVTAGAAAAQQAVQGGQYAHPRGLFFGGRTEAWANRTLRSIVREFLSTASKVVVVDVHTGLGAYGSAELIMNVPTTTGEFARAVAIWGGDRVRSTLTGASVSTHLDASLKLAFRDMLPHAEVTATSLEFGTYPPMQVFTALRAENWLYHHGAPDDPRAHAIRHNLLRVFHPADSVWHGRVWIRGREVVWQALDWLESTAGNAASVSEARQGSQMWIASGLPTRSPKRGDRTLQWSGTRPLRATVTAVTAMLLAGS
jgi:hypothetical protein